MTRAIGLISSVVLLATFTIAQSARALDAGAAWVSVPVIAPPVVAFAGVGSLFLLMIGVSRRRWRRALALAPTSAYALLAVGETRGFAEAEPSRLVVLFLAPSTSEVALVDLASGERWPSISTSDLLDVSAHPSDTATYWGTDLLFVIRAQEPLTVSLEGWPWRTRSSMALRAAIVLGALQSAG